MSEENKQNNESTIQEDTLVLDEIILEYPDGSRKLKKIGTFWGGSFINESAKGDKS